MTWTMQEKTFVISTHFPREFVLLTLPCMAGRHANVSNISGLNDVMESLHLRRCQKAHVTDKVETLQSLQLAFLGQTDDLLTAAMNMVMSKSRGNGTYIAKHRYNPAEVVPDSP